MGTNFLCDESEETKICWLQVNKVIISTIQFIAIEG